MKFKLYGVIGLLLILLAELNFWFRIEPWINFAFIILWVGYILLMDSIVFKLRGESLISNRLNQFTGMALISGIFWLIFDMFNYFIKNWSYTGLEYFGFGKCNELFCLYDIIALASFMTVLPAFFETIECMRSLHIFDSVKFGKKFRINKMFISGLIAAGIIFLFLVVTFPMYTFPLVWIGVFLVLDPINYLNRQPSIINHVKEKEWGTVFSILLSGLVMGLLWEFWNYWAAVKWVYHIPFVDFWHIFEMPILGYLGYLPFSLELYSMYWFMRSLFIGREEKLLK